jgi:hypothetical protein
MRSTALDFVGLKATRKLWVSYQAIEAINHASNDIGLEVYICIYIYMFIISYFLFPPSRVKGMCKMLRFDSIS